MQVHTLSRLCAGIAAPGFALTAARAAGSAHWEPAQTVVLGASALALTGVLVTTLIAHNNNKHNQVMAEIAALWAENRQQRLERGELQTAVDFMRDYVCGKAADCENRERMEKG